MAATQLLAIAKTAATSTDVVVTAGAPVTVAMKVTAGEVFPPLAVINITLKDDGGVYARVGALNAATAAQTLTGPGTYRLERQTISDANSSGVGAFSG